MVHQDEESRDKWNILIIEDAGEFIALDTAQSYGQALAKLLNLSDGLLGQGLRLLILITTNEELENLHPAITRNGRCLTNLEFTEFSEAEARAWLVAQESSAVDLPPTRSLSDLYTYAQGHVPATNRRTRKIAGFVSR